MGPSIRESEARVRVTWRVDPPSRGGDTGGVQMPISPFVLAGRILAILGMAFTAASAILLVLIPEWLWALGAVAAFLPFFGLIVLVERYQARHGWIGPQVHGQRDE